MTEALQFVFSSFWAWLGTIVLIHAFFSFVAAMVAEVRK